MNKFNFKLLSITLLFISAFAIQNTFAADTFEAYSEGVKYRENYSPRKSWRSPSKRPRAGSFESPEKQRSKAKKFAQRAKASRNSSSECSEDTAPPVRDRIALDWVAGAVLRENRS